MPTWSKNQINAFQDNIIYKQENYFKGSENFHNSLGSKDPLRPHHCSKGTTVLRFKNNTLRILAKLECGLHQSPAVMVREKKDKGKNWKKSGHTKPQLGFGTIIYII